MFELHTLLAITHPYAATLRSFYELNKENPEIIGKVSLDFLDGNASAAAAAKAKQRRADAAAAQRQPAPHPGRYNVPTAVAQNDVAALIVNASFANDISRRLMGIESNARVVIYVTYQCIARFAILLPTLCCILSAISAILAGFLEPE